MINGSAIYLIVIFAQAVIIAVMLYRSHGNRRDHNRHDLLVEMDDN
jgi:hypothetical protein